jgi:hypothetical protein
MNERSTLRKPAFLLVARTLAASVLSVALALPTYAQKTTELAPGGGGSAHVKTEWTVAPANISITYGRPTLKKRADSLVMPLGKPWRTGADAATIITTDKALKFGNITIQPGSYTINTQPGASEWQMILGKLGSDGQWGTPYLPDLEIGRAPMKLAKTAAPVEMLTIHIQPGKSAGVLKVEWGTNSASIPFTVLP